MEDLRTSLPEYLAPRVRATWLTIHSKKLEGADTDLCLREAYDVCASALLDCGHELDHVVLDSVIPNWVFQFAEEKKWLPPLGPEDLFDFFTDCLKSRILYWQARAVGLRVRVVLRAEWLRIDSKKLEGAHADLCLREAYEVCASALRDFGQKLNDVVLSQGIPALILYGAAENEWLAAVPPEQRLENVMRCLRSRIEYWQAQELIRAQEKGRSPFRDTRQTYKKLERVPSRIHEDIPENFVRTTLAQQYGIKAENVTWEQLLPEPA